MEAWMEAVRDFVRFGEVYRDWLPLAFLVAIPFVIMPLVAKTSGWSALAKCYAAQEPFFGDTFRFRSARLSGHSNYNCCLTFGADRMGLSIAVWLFFRVGHPPLYIPWQDIRAREVRALFIPMIELRFAKAPQVAVRVTRRLAQTLLERALPPIKIEPRQ